MAGNLTTAVVGTTPAVIYGAPGSTQGITVLNLDTQNTVWLGYTASIAAATGGGGIPVGPGASMQFDGRSSIYAVATASVTVAVGPGVTGYFLPASLTNIGGSKVYVQAGTPTGTIPLNSVWFDTANGSLQTWNGTAWVNQAFNAQQLIQTATILGNQIAAQSVTASNIANGTLTTAQLAAAAGILGAQIAAATVTGSNIAANTITAANIAANTITAAQLAAGIIYAGIINGTTVNAATFTGSVFEGTDFIINSSGAFFYSSTPAAGNLAISVAQFAGTDAFGNGYPAGFASYAPSGTSQIDQGTLILLDSYGNAWSVVPVPQLHSTDPLYLEVFTPAGNSITIANLMPGALAVSQTDVNSHSNTTTSATAITKSWSIPANDAQAGTVYRLKAYGNGAIGGTNTLIGIQEMVGGSNVISTGWNSGAIATSTTFELYVEATIAVKSAGSSGVVEYHIRGEATPHGRVGTAPVVFVDTATTQTLNTTVANTFAVGAAIGTTATGTTIGTFTSTLERLGP